MCTHPFCRYTAEALEQFDSQLGEVVVPDTDWETGPAREHLERDIAGHIHAARCAGWLTLVVRWGAKDAGADGAAAWHTAAGWLAVVCRAVVHSMCNAHFPNSCLHATSPCCRLEHVGESLRAAQQAASKEVTAAAMSLLEAPPADLWPRLGKVHACELAWEAG